MFVPTVPAGLPTVLMLRKVWDAVLGRVDGRLICVALAPELRGVTLVSEKEDGALALAFFLVGVPEPADLNEYRRETDVQADTVYKAAAYLNQEYGHWIVRDGMTNKDVAARLSLYATLISLCDKEKEK